MGTAYHSGFLPNHQSWRRRWTVRDPQRFEDVLLAIAEVWSLDPDLRLGQLLINAVRPARPCPELYSIEDWDLVRRVQAEGRRMRLAKGTEPEA
jgi:hypothetical protein